MVLNGDRILKDLLPVSTVFLKGRGCVWEEQNSHRKAEESLERLVTGLSCASHVGKCSESAHVIILVNVFGVNQGKISIFVGTFNKD